MPNRIHEAREAVGLEGVRVPREVHRLSGGTRQRLALAGLVVARPDILVLDEPVANVDPEGAAQVWATVERLVEGRRRSLIVIEHAPDDVRHAYRQLRRLQLADGEIGNRICNPVRRLRGRTGPNANKDLPWNRI